MSKLIPCPECVSEAFDGENTMVMVEDNFEFGGNKAIRELAGKVCPECGHEIPL